MLRGEPGARSVFRDRSDLRRFVVVGVIFAPALIGVVGYSVLAWSGLGSWSDFAEGWRTYAIGDAIGIAVVTPALLAASSRYSRDGLRRPAAVSREAALQTLAVIALPLLPMLFYQPRPVLLGIILVPLAWVAMTRSFLATTVASLSPWG